MNRYHDLFFNTHGIAHIAPAPVAVDSLQALYMQGIAMPEVAIVDRRQEYKPVILDEGGQPLTWERRQELWRNKKKLNEFTAGEVIDYRKELEDLPIEPEARTGAAAKAMRPGIRRVPIKDVGFHFTLEVETLPLCVDSAVPNSRWSTGGVELEQWNVRQHLNYMVQHLYNESGRAITKVRMSTAALRTLRDWHAQWLKEYYLGAAVVIEDTLGNKLIFTTDIHPTDETDPPSASAWLALAYD